MAAKRSKFERTGRDLDGVGAQICAACPWCSAPVILYQFTDCLVVRCSRPACTWWRLVDQLGQVDQVGPRPG